MRKINLEATASKIKSLMKKNNISVIQLAEYTMVSKGAVYKWLHGSSLPDIENLIAMSDLFSVKTIEDILVFDNTDGAPISTC